MKVGDLVTMPSFRSAPGIVGVVVDITTKASENKIGVSWPDSDNEIDFEPRLWLTAIDRCLDKE